MATRTVSLLSLFCVCGAAGAQHADELDALEFFPGQGGMALTAAPSSPPSSEPSAEQIDAIRAKVARIAAVEAEQGARSNELAAELVALGALYREVGDHALAIDALERALGVLRMNDGLHTLDQVPLLEDIIENRIALREFDEAAGLDRAVLELVARNPGDRRIPEILVGVGDREMAAVDRFIEFGSAPEFNVGITPQGAPLFMLDRQQLVPGSREFVPISQGMMGGTSVVSGRRAALMSLRRARAHYGTAIAATPVAAGSDIAELFAIEQKVIDTFYAEIVNPELLPSRHGASFRDMPVFRPGERALEAHVLNSRNHRRTPVAVAEALLRLGDWQLLFSRNATALATYESARELLTRENVPDDIIKDLLTPAAPPALMPPPRSGEAVDYRGFVDVELVVGRYGRVKDVEVVGASADTSDRIVKRAKRYLANTRVRPRFIDGRLPRNDRVVTRYYYDY